MDVIFLAAFARPVRGSGPQRPYDKSDPVLTEIVTQVRDTRRTSTIRLASNPPLRVMSLRASMRVTDILKGKTNGEVLVEYARPN